MSISEERTIAQQHIGAFPWIMVIWGLGGFLLWLAHGNIARPNTPLRWLNELVGHLSVFPMIFPYRLHRAIHLKHHAHSNDAVRDPDMYMKADTIWGAAKNAWLSK